jgi:hypothetical protein
MICMNVERGHYLVQYLSLRLPSTTVQVQVLRMSTPCKTMLKGRSVSELPIPGPRTERVVHIVVIEVAYLGRVG